MTPLDLLRQLNELDEHPRIEAKEASEMGRSVLETVCALANEPGLGGGWLLLGVKPDEQAFWRKYEVIGVQNSDKLQSDLASQCATSAIYYVPTERFVSSLFPELPGSPEPASLSGTPPSLSGNLPALSGNPQQLSGNPRPSRPKEERMNDEG